MKIHDPPYVVPAQPIPGAAEIARGIKALRACAKRKVRPHDLGARDESFIRDLLPLMGAFYDHYFRCETEFESELPTGPFLAVANHNGMTGTPDMFCHMAAFWRYQTPSRLAYGLMHDMPFHTPAAGAWLNAAGALAANPVNAKAALDKGATVLVFPGGDVDACRPYRDRYEIRFGKRRGFIRLAIEMGVPIVPIVSAGAHESLYIYSDGARFAEWSGMKKYFRSNVAPIGFAFPWGLIAGIPYPHISPPVKVHTRILKPIDLGEPSSSASDPERVESCFQRVHSLMQSTMDDLRAEGRHGLFPRSPKVDSRGIS